MTVLDAYALIAYLRGEPAADDVMALLRQPTAVSSVNLAEVVDQMTRVFGQDEDEVEMALATLAAGGMSVLVPEVTTGLAAGRLRARHYDRRERSVSLADCFAAAIALHDGDPLATSDPHLADMVVAEGGSVVPLPDSSGRRPAVS